MSSTHRYHSLRAQHTEIIHSELNIQISFTQSSTHRHHSLRAQHTYIIHYELNTQISFTQSSTHRDHSLRAQHTDIIPSELNTQISFTQSSTHRDHSLNAQHTDIIDSNITVLNKIPLSVVAYFPVCLCALNNLIFCVPGVISSPNSTMNISRIVTGLFLAGVLVLCLSEAGPVPGGRIKRSESPSPKNLCGDKLCVCKCPDGDHCNISECSNSKDCWVICA